MLRAHINDQFDNLLQYRSWVDHNMQHLKPGNRQHEHTFDRHFVERLTRNSDWYGAGVTYDELEAGITQYKDPDLIEKIYNQVSDQISAISTAEIKSRKISYNPFGLGVFCFDRAAMGMYRLKEFFDPATGYRVDTALVSVQNGNTVRTTDGSQVEERWELRTDGRPKVRTSAKSVFAFYPKVSKEKQAVEILLCAGGNADIDAQRFLYGGISGIIVAEMLEKAGVPVRITVAIGSSPDNYKQSVYCSLVPVKDYSEPLDKNLLATLTSDPRFFRYEGFKGVISAYNHFGARCPDSLGAALNPRNLWETIEKSTNNGRAKSAPNRVYMGATFSAQETIRTIKEVISGLAEKLKD